MRRVGGSGGGRMAAARGRGLGGHDHVPPEQKATPISRSGWWLASLHVLVTPFFGGTSNSQGFGGSLLWESESHMEGILGGKGGSRDSVPSRVGPVVEVEGEEASGEKKIRELSRRVARQLEIALLLSLAEWGTRTKMVEQGVVACSMSVLGLGRKMGHWAGRHWMVGCDIHLCAAFFWPTREKFPPSTRHETRTCSSFYLSPSFSGHWADNGLITRVVN